MHSVHRNPQACDHAQLRVQIQTCPNSCSHLLLHCTAFILCLYARCIHNATLTLQTDVTVLAVLAVRKRLTRFSAKFAAATLQNMQWSDSMQSLMRVNTHLAAVAQNGLHGSEAQEFDSLAQTVAAAIQSSQAGQAANA